MQLKLSLCDDVISAMTNNLCMIRILYGMKCIIIILLTKVQNTSDSNEIAIYNPSIGI